MNAARLALSRIAAAAFRRMCGNPIPLPDVPWIAGLSTGTAAVDAVTAARNAAMDARTAQLSAWRAEHNLRGTATNDTARRAADHADASETNRDRYVHTSVSHDEAHAANDEGDGRPTNVVPFRYDNEGRPQLW